MPTIFYQAKYESVFPITGLFLELLGIKLQSFEQTPTNEETAVILLDCLKESGLRKEPAEDDLRYVVEELEKRHQDSEEKRNKEGESNKTGKGKHFAGYFASWASEMTYDKLCLYVADYDFTKAKDYYETQDQQTIVAIADEKLRLEFEKVRAAFEAALFGFGGGYKDTPREGDSSFDLTEDSKSAERALKNMGF
jgi:hypothetical protein